MLVTIRYTVNDFSTVLIAHVIIRDEISVEASTLGHPDGNLEEQI